MSEELDPPLAEFVLLPEDEEELSGLELELLGGAEDPADEDDDELGGVTLPVPGLLLLASLVEDPTDEDDDELGGVALLPVPALPVLGRCSPQAASAAATAATAHSFANVRKVLSMSALLESDEKATLPPAQARRVIRAQAIDMPDPDVL